MLWFDFWFCLDVWLQQSGLLMMSFVCWHTDLTVQLLLLLLTACSFSVFYIMGEIDLIHVSY